MKENRVENAGHCFTKVSKSFWRIGAMWDVVTHIEEMALITHGCQAGRTNDQRLRENTSPLGRQATAQVITPNGKGP
jgi:hypothetical protein